MLVVEHNEHHYNWRKGDLVRILDYCGDVVIAFDPSKTNMACVIGTPTGTVIETIEFSGNNRGAGPPMDTTVYCEELRAFLKSYLQKVQLYLVGVEAAITKRGQGYHHSNMVLTEIRANVLNFFKEEYGVRVTEVNNWSWKSYCLPQGYRSQSEKGSKRYYVENYPDSPYSKYFAADMTDCLCIFKYLVDHECSAYSGICNRIELCDTKYSSLYLPVTWENRHLFNQVTFNPDFTIEQNTNFYVNRLLRPFLMQIPASLPTYEDIYEKARFFEVSNFKDTEILVLTRRR